MRQIMTSSHPVKPSSIRPAWHESLGASLITGAADDDSSGIAKYSQGVALGVTIRAGEQLPGQH